MIQRRGFLAGLGALLAAPAIIRTPGLLMPVRPVVTLVLAGVDFGKDNETIVFCSTPSSMENGLFWRRWMDLTAKDVDYITGCSLEMLGTPSREQSSAAIEERRRLIFGDWSDAVVAPAYPGRVRRRG